MKKIFPLLLINIFFYFQGLPGQDLIPPSYEQLTKVFTKIAHNVIPSVLKVAALPSNVTSCDNLGQEAQYGSGFLISEEGHILTCNHLVENADRIFVSFASQEIEALLTWSDSKADIAMLKIKGVNFPFLRLGNSDTIDVGEWVVAIGYPFSLHPFITRGIIGSKDELGKRLFLDMLICQGGSGGPLLNLKGEVIGVINALLQSRIGIAIPINQIKEHLP